MTTVRLILVVLVCGLCMGFGLRRSLGMDLRTLWPRFRLLNGLGSLRRRRTAFTWLAATPAAIAAAPRAATITAAFAALALRAAGAAVLPRFFRLAAVRARCRLAHHRDRHAHQFLNGYDRL